MTPFVSILIPAFNAERWIAGTIRSALEQTWPRKEIIIVDDGSTDRTLAVARGFSSEAVCVVPQSNRGAAAARNKAFSICKGDYIQWLDADDLLAPDKIAKQVEALDRCRSTRTLLSGAWGKFIYRSSSAKFFPTALWCDLVPLEWLLRKWEQHVYMPNATWLVSRELTETAGPWDCRLSLDDDGEYFCRIILGSDEIRFIPEARTFYRKGFESLSYVGGSNRKLESQFLSMRLQIGYLLAAADSERVRAACIKYLQTWLIMFYPERPDIVRETQDLAKTLGGSLQFPRLGWKYAWLEKALGWRLAKRAQLGMPRLKTSLIKIYDRALLHLEKRNVATNHPGQRPGEPHSSGSKTSGPRPDDTSLSP